MNKWTNISDKTDTWNNRMNANAIIGCKYCSQYRQFNVHIYLLKHRFNQIVHKWIQLGKIWGLLCAQGTYYTGQGRSS